MVIDPLPPRLVGTATAVDGDTLRLGGSRVRLAGLDAPEADQTCTRTDGSTWRCGLVAKRRLADLLGRGETTCVPEERDRHGRFIARCQTDGGDLGTSLVLEGLAIAELDYAHQQAEARTAKRGIWNGDFESPRAFRDRTHGNDILNWLRSWFQ